MEKSTYHPVSDDSRIILDGIRRLVQSIRVASRESEKKVGLSAAQLFVLHKLGEDGGLSINELANHTLTHQSSVSVVVQKLADQGLVIRSKSDTDARQLNISLTHKGKALLKKAPHAVQDTIITALEKMKPESRRQLSRTLSQFLHKAGIADKSAPLLFDDTLQKKGWKK